MKTLSQIKEERNPLGLTSDQELKESLVGKGVAISNNRQHAAYKTKLFSLISQIQNRCRQGVNEGDYTEKINLQFQIAFDLASALKIFAEMSTNTNNISTTAVLDQETFKKELAPIIKKLSDKSQK